jgi:hypothetical protein
MRTKLFVAITALFVVLLVAGAALAFTLSHTNAPQPSAVTANAAESACPNGCCPAPCCDDPSACPYGCCPCDACGSSRCSAKTAAK